MSVSEGSEVFIGRQPIFDRKQRVAGYEILFRGGHVEQADVVDAEAATATVVLNALTEIGVERIVGSHIAWVNLPRESVLSGVGTMLPPQVTGFEILEGQVIDDELIEGIRVLKRAEYKIALDDFVYSDTLEPLLALADVVKLDYLALGPEGFAEQVELLKPYTVGPHKVSLLAEKVETYEAHDFCLEQGCSLFQGFFFKKPELLHERRIELASGSVLQVTAALLNPDLQFDELEPLIARDVPLSMRLLRYMNSAFFGLEQEIHSVRQALVLLGLNTVRRWATLTLMGSLEGKTSELTSTALIRARFCELAGVAAGFDGAQMFTIGLFSLIDAMMDAPLEEVLDQLPFPEDMRAALLWHEGPKGRILDAATALEEAYYADARLSVEHANELYVDALTWAQEASGALFEAAAVSA